jgi:hypothetical protein
VGLWVGDISLNAVNEVNAATNVAAPKPTKSEFRLRLLVHVDTNGVSRLLKEVIQMYQPPVYTTNAGGYRVATTPPQEVLVTEDARLTDFEGGLTRDGEPVGRRLSSAAFDFDGHGTNALALSGAFGGTNVLAGTITLAANFPTNPFRHKYHPDHDNLDATFRNARAEAYPVVRQFALQFAANAPPGVAALDYGYNVAGGTYTETISGLHKTNLVVQGDFLLHRVSTASVLNP